jgi:nitroreductase
MDDLVFDEGFREHFYKLLQHRRSIRKYKPTPVSRELVEKLIKDAGCWAPSGKNRQNWYFFIATGAKRDEYLKYSQKSWLGVKDVLAKRLKPSLYQFTERFFFTLGDAPVYIFAYTRNDQEERYLTSLGSVYMSVENILLAAEAEGLGACPMGAVLEIEGEVNEFVGKEKTEGLQLLCGITLGYPDHQPPAAPRQFDGRITWL